MSELLRLLPAIKRSRGNRLYADNGKRYLDLWLDDGHNLLSYKENLTRTQASNAADKGLVRPYPGLYEKRIKKELIKAWPEFSVIKIFLSMERAMALAKAILSNNDPLLDSAFFNSNTVDSGFYLARPFIGLAAKAQVILARIPCPRIWAPICLMAKSKSQEAGALSKIEDDLVPPLSHIAGARALASISSLEQQGYTEKAWQEFYGPIQKFFSRNGPYLLPRLKGSAYKEFFMAALEGGALLSPQEDKPSIIPLDWDKGELARLVKAI